jgi:hypothetical protein
MTLYIQSIATYALQIFDRENSSMATKKGGSKKGGSKKGSKKH